MIALQILAVVPFTGKVVGTCYKSEWFGLEGVFKVVLETLAFSLLTYILVVYIGLL